MPGPLNLPSSRRCDACGSGLAVTTVGRSFVPLKTCHICDRPNTLLTLSRLGYYDA